MPSKTLHIFYGPNNRPANRPKLTAFYYLDESLVYINCDLEETDKFEKLLILRRVKLINDNVNQWPHFVVSDKYTIGKFCKDFKFKRAKYK